MVLYRVSGHQGDNDFKVTSTLLCLRSNTVSPSVQALRQRLLEILRRHIDPETDVTLSDDDLVKQVMERYEYWRRQPVIDPNE